MASQKPYFLSASEVTTILESFEPSTTIEVVRIRYKNHHEIRRPEQITVEELKALILEAMEEGHQYGGNLEVPIPTLCKTLVGHHDGIYWLEP